ncbi:MAG: tolB protein precursor, partial [Sphingobacteriaceae bacterium]
FAPTIDFRKYWRIAPVTLAARVYGLGRFGDTGNLYPMFLGYPFLIRGYEAQSFYNNNTESGAINIQSLQGNRLAVANFEVRLPFTGPEKLAQIKSGFLFTDLNLFFDAGLAWNGGNEVKFQKEPDIIDYNTVYDADGQPVNDGNGNAVQTPVYNSNQRVPVYSAGVSLRVNLFGALILEPYFAIPFNRTDVKKPVFGLAFTPGW